MQEAKNTARALVRIGYDGRVHKHFKGLHASERFENEQYVLNFSLKKVVSLFLAYLAAILKNCT